MNRIAAYFDINPKSTFYGGVAGELHRRRFSYIQAYCEKNGWLPIGKIEAGTYYSDVILEASKSKSAGYKKSENEIAADCDIYNFEALAKQNKIPVSSPETILKTIVCKGLQNTAFTKSGIAESLDKALRDVKGAYSIIGKIENYVFVVSDIEGLKAIWHDCKNGFSVASEKKFLPPDAKPEKLDPRKILVYDTNERTCNLFEREHNFELGKVENNCDFTVDELQNLLEKAIKLRIPDEPFGILFSGGLDSSLIATLCKKVKPECEITCYTASFEGGKEAPDLAHARKVAEKLGIPLKVASISIEQAEKDLKTLVSLLETTAVPTLGVALALYAATKAASEDGIKILLTGSGADEMFGGYNRHKNAENLAEECRKDTLGIHVKDTYRDELIGSEFGISLRAPFLDKNVMEYALALPNECRVHNDENKYILRQIAGIIGMTDETAHRPKKAAQYGSRSDKAIKELTKKHGYTRKSDYLYSLKEEEEKEKIPLGVLFSSGKDCNYALHLMNEKGHPIKCLITIRSQNPDSYMFHTPNINLAQMQADAMGIPLIEWNTEGEKEVELEDLKEAIQKAIREFGIKGIITGALHSNYQRERIENICRELGIEAFSPLWGMNQEEEMRELLDYGFSFIFSSIAAYGLNSRWVGKVITEADIDKLAKLNEKIGLNVAGEGGEFESFVLDAPLFRKKIEVLESSVKELDEYTARLVIEKAILVEK